MFQKLSSYGNMFGKATSAVRNFAAKAAPEVQAIARQIGMGSQTVQRIAGDLERIPVLSPLATIAKNVAGGVGTIARGVATVRGNPEQVVNRLVPVLRRGAGQLARAL